MNNEYKFVGKPLTPNIAQELIQELFTEQTVQKQEIVRIVDETHLERGGLAPRAKGPHPVTMALSKMKRDRQADNPDRGYWSILSPEDDESANSGETNFDSERTIGLGKEAVYLYYFPAYKCLAELQGEEVWPCKIGSSVRDPLSRIRAQTRTSSAEYPKVGLIIKTNQSSLLENIIQDILKFQGKQKQDTAGTEWFVTSPSEVERVYKRNFENLE